MGRGIVATGARSCGQMMAIIQPKATKGIADFDRVSGILIFPPEAVITEERVAEGGDPARRHRRRRHTSYQ
jgi:hypothetical protein